MVASNLLEISPYVKQYAIFLRRDGIEFDILEKGFKNFNGKTEASFTYGCSETNTVFGKFFRFAKYAMFVRERLKKGNYDRTVLFSATNSTFCFFLCHKYLKNRYLIDLRDYEKIVQMPILRRFFLNCVQNAKLVVISSSKFLSWLPSDCPAVVMHNLPNPICRNEHSTCFQSDIIQIGYMGGIGYYAENVALVNALSESSKYHLVYRGIYPDKDNIKDYCREQSIRNVSFYGKYANKDKQSLYGKIDFINAIYGNSSLIVTTALPNKLYDCLCYKIPIIASKGTYFAELIEKFGVGVAIDVVKDNIEQKLDEYIEAFDRTSFEKNCNLLLDIVMCEQKEAEKRIAEFLEGKDT